MRARATFWYGVKAGACAGVAKSIDLGKEIEAVVGESMLTRFYCKERKKLAAVIVCVLILDTLQESNALRNLVPRSRGLIFYKVMLDPHLYAFLYNGSN